MLNRAQMSTWVRSHKAMLLVAALLLLLDRVSKVWTLTYLAEHGPVRLLSYFWLNYVENTGAAFGMFQHANMLLVVVMFLVIGYIMCSWKDLTQYGMCSQWGAMLILTGAFGNLYDRLTLGFVVDMLDFRVWPVFNVADSCITVGAILLAISLLKRCKKERRKNEKNH